MKVIFQSLMSLDRSSISSPPLDSTKSLECALAVVEEVVLNSARAVAEAQDELGVPEVRVVQHDVPQHRPVADRHHRLGQRVGVPDRIRMPSPPENSTTFICVLSPKVPSVGRVACPLCRCRLS